MARTPSSAHVFVADVDRPELAPGDRHHLLRVLRLRNGEVLTASDGAGRWRWCRFGPGAGASLEPVGDVESEPRPEPPLALGFALTKGERPELAVQKLTELGVDRIVPFTADRSIVRWDAAVAAARVERWRRIAREAASQSRRVWLPEVDPITSFAALVERTGVALAHPGGEPPSLRHGLVLIGPEGGWSDEELTLAAGRGVPHVSVGAHVLRAETASLAAGTLLGALRAQLVAES